MHSIPLEEDEPPFEGAPAAAPAQAEVELLGDLRGHRLAGRYLLVELLGSGDLGCVYAGRDDVGGQGVTVKVLALAEHREVVFRLADRARQRFGLRHPALAGLLAEGNIGGLWYAVFEEASGKNCYHAQGDPRLEGAGLQGFALALAEGLAAVHGAGAVHGAISPGNVVWGDAGPRLVDLDLSLTEQTGELDPGAADDVRALAGVLVELAHGREDAASSVVDRLGAIARGEARLSAAEWVAELRAAPTAAPAAPPSLAAPPAAPSLAEAFAAPSLAEAPGASAPGESIPELSGSDLVSETGSHAQVPEDSAAASASPPASAEKLAEEAGPATAAATAAETAEPPEFGRASFEPVRATIVGDEEDEDWGRAAPQPRRRRTVGWVVGLVAVVVLAVIGWQLQRGPEPTSEAPPAPAEVAPAKRADLSSEVSTLASVAAPPTPTVVAAEPVPPPLTADGAATLVAADTAAEDALAPEGEGEEEEGVAGVGEQLSAADFRRILLRANRSPAARTCYRVHWQDPADVDLIATVGPRGTIRKLRMGEGDLAGCLRKIVLGLDFPRAARSAQHNFTFHRPSEAD